MECKTPRTNFFFSVILIGLFFLSQLLVADVAASGSVISLIMLGGKQAQDPPGSLHIIVLLWSEAPSRGGVRNDSL